jgi:hypothetical protein
MVLARGRVRANPHLQARHDLHAIIEKLSPERKAWFPAFRKSKRKSILWHACGAMSSTMMG